jgi:ABC-2 type transport system ATP-binding protein
MSAIELRNISNEYGDVTTVDGLDLTVENGEVCGFLSPNGTGKSTTINILLDFVRPTRGDISVLGMDPQEESLSIRRRAGLLPEGAAVYDRLTARQHVKFMIEAKGATDDPDAVMERVGIAHAADRRAGGFSKGMQQRLALGLALVGQPDLIIFDEPSTGLDPNGADEVLDIMREEKARGATIFFSSHVLGQVEAICDRVGILRNSEIVAVDSIEGLRDAAGEGSMVVVNTDGVTNEAIEAVETTGGVSEVTADGTQLRISCTDDAKTAVIGALEDAGVTVSDFSTEETSLESLFTHYTEGKR